MNFEKLEKRHLNIIFSWLDEPFIKEFWDNSVEHKNDMINFVDGRRTPSPYCNGKYSYWIATLQHEPFAMIMTIKESLEEKIDQIKLDHLSTTGHTYGLDFMIGNKNFFGRGYASLTLINFMNYFREHVDAQADRFLIDPDASNLRAIHVYRKAGFVHVGDFVMTGNCSGSGKLHHLLVKSFST